MKDGRQGRCRDCQQLDNFPGNYKGSARCPKCGGVLDPLSPTARKGRIRRRYQGTERESYNS